MRLYTISSGGLAMRKFELFRQPDNPADWFQYDEYFCGARDSISEIEALQRECLAEPRFKGAAAWILYEYDNAMVVRRTVTETKP